MSAIYATSGRGEGGGGGGGGGAEGGGDRHQMRRASDRTKDPPTQTVLNMENIYLLNSEEHNLMLNLTSVFNFLTNRMF